MVSGVEGEGVAPPGWLGNEEGMEISEKWKGAGGILSFTFTITFTTGDGSRRTGGGVPGGGGI